MAFSPWEEDVSEQLYLLVHRMWRISMTEIIIILMIVYLIVKEKGGK